jgi:hypothetical protein
VMDSKFCYSYSYCSYSAFLYFVNVWPLNRRFHSNRPVKFGLFILKMLCHFSRASCSHFSLNCPFKNDICMCVLYFIHTPPPQLLGLKLGLFLITGAVI